MKLTFIAMLAIAATLTIGSCSSLTSTNGNTAKSDAPPANANTKTDDSNTKSPAPSKVEKADFTYTAEDLDLEFTKKGAKDKDLDKFSKKNIAVTGRVSTLVTEKTGNVQPWVTLFAPGVLHGVSCYFDDDNVEQMKMLKKDKMAKIQGFEDGAHVPGISPMLNHCVVLEGSQ